MANISFGKYISWVIAAIVVVFFATYFINKSMPTIPVADYGVPLLTLTILLAGFITYRFAVVDHKLDKKDVIGFLVFVAIIFVAVVYLPQWFPTIFSGDLALSKIVDSTGLLKSTIRFLP